MVELNKIYNENCLETMSRMDDGSIDLVVTSPPYDNLRTYNGYSFDFESIAKELYRVIKPGGVMVWVVGDSTINGSETLTSCKQKIFFREQCGFNIHDTMIYEKENISFPDSVRYYNAFEYMFVLSRGVPKTFNPLTIKNPLAGKPVTSTLRGRDGIVKPDSGYLNGKLRPPESVLRNIWRYATGSEGVGMIHPAIFPEQLAKDHIYSWSNEGEIVYDPFGGSGTTAKMSHLAKRNWIISEISSEYCEISRKRLLPYLQQTQLF